MPMRWSKFRRSQNEPPLIPLETEVDDQTDTTLDLIDADGQVESEDHSTSLSDESDKL